jgi:hypothetical protein
MNVSRVVAAGMNYSRQERRGASLLKMNGGLKIIIEMTQNSSNYLLYNALDRTRVRNLSQISGQALSKSLSTSHHTSHRSAKFDMRSSEVRRLKTTSALDMLLMKILR